jgi:hypothetical protein
VQYSADVIQRLPYLRAEGVGQDAVVSNAKLAGHIDQVAQADGLRIGGVLRRRRGDDKGLWCHGEIT